MTGRRHSYHCDGDIGASKAEVIAKAYISSPQRRMSQPIISPLVLEISDLNLVSPITPKRKKKKTKARRRHSKQRGKGNGNINSNSDGSDGCAEGNACKTGSPLVSPISKESPKKKKKSKRFKDITEPMGIVIIPDCDKERSYEDEKEIINDESARFSAVTEPTQLLDEDDFTAVTKDTKDASSKDEILIYLNPPKSPKPLRRKKTTKERTRTKTADKARTKTPEKTRTNSPTKSRRSSLTKSLSQKVSTDGRTKTPEKTRTNSPTKSRRSSLTKSLSQKVATDGMTKTPEKTRTNSPTKSRRSSLTKSLSQKVATDGRTKTQEKSRTKSPTKSRRSSLTKSLSKKVATDGKKNESWGTDPNGNTTFMAPELLNLLVDPGLQLNDIDLRNTMPLKKSSSFHSDIDIKNTMPLKRSNSFHGARKLSSPIIRRNSYGSNLDSQSKLRDRTLRSKKHKDTAILDSRNESWAAPPSSRNESWGRASCSPELRNLYTSPCGAEKPSPQLRRNVKSFNSVESWRKDPKRDNDIPSMLFISQDSSVPSFNESWDSRQFDRPSSGVRRKDTINGNKIDERARSAGPNSRRRRSSTTSQKNERPPQPLRKKEPKRSSINETWNTDPGNLGNKVPLSPCLLDMLGMSPSTKRKSPGRFKKSPSFLKNNLNKLRGGGKKENTMKSIPML